MAFVQEGVLDQVRGHHGLSLPSLRASVNTVQTM